MHLSTKVRAMAVAAAIGVCASASFVAPAEASSPPKLAGSYSHGQFYQQIHDSITVNSGTSSEPTEIMLLDGSTFATFGSRSTVKPYAICIKDVWTAEGSEMDSFALTAPWDGSAFSYSPSSSQPEQTYGVTPHWTRTWYNLSQGLYCTLGNWRVRTPLPGGGSYWLQVSAIKGHIKAIQHTQTAEVFYTQAAFQRNKPNIRHTISKHHSF